MRRKNIIFLLLLLAALIMGFLMTIAYASRARFFPLIVICSCGVLVLMELIKASLVRSESAHQDKKANEAGKMKGRQFLLATAWLGGFTLSIWLLGFAIGMPLFILAYLKMYGEKWLWTIILPVTMFVIVKIGFGLLLETPLYEGLLFLP
jgi:hypothetical protein